MAPGASEPVALVAVRPADADDRARAPARPTQPRHASARIPSGHPEGYLEAFATLYAEIAQAIRATRPGGPKADTAAHFPTVDDGLKGVEFIEAVVASSKRGGRWVKLSA